ncbi:MAG TPA: hypothetical protein VNR60_00840 [Croceibacterium sp.]|nr:hypothetical protein [Croceibacterium sp.]
MYHSPNLQTDLRNFNRGNDAGIPASRRAAVLAAARGDEAGESWVHVAWFAAAMLCMPALILAGYLA